MIRMISVICVREKHLWSLCNLCDIKIPRQGSRETSAGNVQVLGRQLMKRQQILTVSTARFKWCVPRCEYIAEQPASGVLTGCPAIYEMSVRGYSSISSSSTVKMSVEKGGI